MHHRLRRRFLLQPRRRTYNENPPKRTSSLPSSSSTMPKGFSTMRATRPAYHHLLTPWKLLLKDSPHLQTQTPIHLRSHTSPRLPRCNRARMALHKPGAIQTPPLLRGRFAGRWYHPWSTVMLTEFLAIAVQLEHRSGDDPRLATLFVMPAVSTSKPETRCAQWA